MLVTSDQNKPGNVYFFVNKRTIIIITNLRLVEKSTVLLA
jgi:hypothetical protein